MDEYQRTRKFSVTFEIGNAIAIPNLPDVRVMVDVFANTDGDLIKKIAGYVEEFNETLTARIRAAKENQVAKKRVISKKKSKVSRKDPFD